MDEIDTFSDGQIKKVSKTHLNRCKSRRAILFPTRAEPPRASFAEAAGAGGQSQFCTRPPPTSLGIRRSPHVPRVSEQRMYTPHTAGAALGVILYRYSGSFRDSLRSRPAHSRSRMHYSIFRVSLDALI